VECLGEGSAELAERDDETVESGGHRPGERRRVDAIRTLADADGRGRRARVVHDAALAGLGEHVAAEVVGGGTGDGEVRLEPAPLTALEGFLQAVRPLIDPQDVVGGS
jgi:hypothetical protein